MKEIVLATKDEKILLEEGPLLVSDRRIYISGSGKINSKNIKKIKIIQLKSLSALRVLLDKRPVFLVCALIFLLLGLCSGGVFLYLYLAKDLLINKIGIYLLSGLGLGLLLFILFIILYGTKRDKVIWFEYPNNLINKPTKIVFKHLKYKRFKEIISIIFTQIDHLENQNNKIDIDSQLIY